MIATNTVTRGRDEDVAYAVACVTIFGSLSMILLPLAENWLTLGPRGFGLWTGASIHEVAQVVAAAFQRGEEAGQFGTIAKLTRVMMLAPMILCLGAFAARRRQGQGGGGKAPIPWFVFGFIAMVGVASTGWVPQAVLDPATAVTQFLLAMALAAMGLETDLRKLAAAGGRPALLGAAAWVFIMGGQPCADHPDGGRLMTLDQLRIFVAVAEREHMTRAAEALNQTQSATSAAIAALEERHNLRLFDRIGRRIVLTDAGRDFLSEARAVLARAAIASQRLDDLAGVKRGKLRLAASQTVANYWLPAVIARFREAHPEIALTVRIGNSDDAARAVEALQADIGIIEGDCQLTTLRAKAVAGDTLRLVFPSGAAGGDLSPERLRHTPWILREAGSGTRDSFLQWLGRQGLGLEELESTLELPSNEAVCSAVEAGIGAALLSDLVVRRSIEAGRMVDVPIDTPQRRFHILTHAERQPSALEARFIHHAETSA